MEQAEVRIRGTRPLLMHAPNNIGKGKEREQLPTPDEEAKAGLYQNGDGIFVPSLNLLASIKAVAGDYKVGGKGKKSYKGYIFSGIGIEPHEIPLQSESGWQVDLRPAVVNRSRIMRARPRFDDWSLEFTLQIIDPIISLKVARQLLEAAGRYAGICDYRPLFGLFEVEEFTS